MSQTHTITIGRHSLTNIFAILAVLCLISVVGCANVPINPDDSSPPNVTIKVKGPNGYEEQTSVKHGNNTEQQPIEIMCIVEDPEGVQSIDLRVSDNTVNAARCGGGFYSGNFVVDGLPSPVEEIVSSSSGKVPTKLSGIIVIPGILQLATKLPGETQACYPANNTKVTVRCQGRNWSSHAGASTTTKYFQVRFVF